jgi:ABC-type lipoprotein release transport system permease subunit
MDSLVFRIPTWDPTVFVAVIALLSAVGFLAMSIPSSRAACVDPATALRS